jgi:hypothetical protein
MKSFLILFLLFTFIGPVFIVLSKQIDFSADYRTANRNSAKLAPNPNLTPEAVIQVYSARTFNWRGIFAVHTWIAIKPQNAKSYTVYQVIGWLLFRNLPPLSIHEDIPDRYWFDQKPQIILDIRGKVAEDLIPQIVTAAAAYPYPNEYRYWPGPNSNTFTAFIGHQVPALQLALPSNAVGKDYLPHFSFFQRAPSGTGYQFSIYGVLGITLALREGLEINLLGLVYGVSPLLGTIKLPGFGDIRIFGINTSTSKK